MPMRSRFLLTFLAVLSISLGPARAERPEFGGYWKDYAVIYDVPQYGLFGPYGGIPAAGKISNRLRADCRYRISRIASLTVAYELIPVLEDRRLFLAEASGLGAGGHAYRFDDLAYRPYPDDPDRFDGFALFQNLDRAFVSLALPSTDVYIGRQPVAWGSARAVNPTDVIAPYSHIELDTEYRNGVDAVRAQIALGSLGELDVGYVFGEDFEFARSAMFLRGRYNFAGNDLSLMTVGFRENLLLGCDLARSIAGAGFWLETAYVIDDALAKTPAGDDDYLRLSTGLDYSLTGSLYGFIEYHFNGPGASDAGGYPGVLSSTAWIDGAVFLLGRQYLIPGFTYQLTPLVMLRGEALCNLGDPSFLIVPSVEYNAAQNVYLSAGAYVGAGASGDADAAGSEFGSYPDMYYASFRLYF